MTARETRDGVWLTGGALIRLALLVPPVVGLLLGAWVASDAPRANATGLDAANRGWFFLMAVPAQFGCVVVVSSELASWYFGLAALPAWACRIVLSLRYAPRLSPAPTPNPPGLLRTLATALGLAFGGSFLVFLAVPIQVLLTTWLLARPDLYSGTEKFLVGIESAAAIAWLGYLVRGVWRHRRERGTPTTSGY